MDVGNAEALVSAALLTFFWIYIDSRTLSDFQFVLPAKAGRACPMSVANVLGIQKKMAVNTPIFIVIPRLVPSVCEGAVEGSRFFILCHFESLPQEPSKCIGYQACIALRPC